MSLINNSQEYNSNQVKREQMLQQIILDQKQRIRELETVEGNPPLKYQAELQQKTLQIKELKQQLFESNQQLQESKTLLTDVLAQRDQSQEQVKLLYEELELKKNQEKQLLENEYADKFQKLQEENNQLLKEIQQNQPLKKALQNYTKEEVYIEQINILHDFLHNWDKQYMSEIVHYKRAADISRQSNEQISNRFYEDKKNLQKQIDDLLKLDQQIQEDVLLKIYSLQDSLLKFESSLNQLNQELLVSNQKNFNKLEALYQDGLNQEQIHLKEKKLLQKQLKETAEQYETQIITLKKSYIPYQDNSTSELFKIAQQEKQQLETALADMRDLSLKREKVQQKEIERYKEQCEYLLAQAQNREHFFEEEIKQLKQFVHNLERNYDSRENFINITDRHLQDLLDSFRSIIQQLKTQMQDKKGVDIVKECKELIIKLSDTKQCKQHKKIPSIDRLENLVRELNKAPNNKLGEEIKQLIIEVTRNILNSKEYKNLNPHQNLLEAIQNLETLITCPNKKVDELLLQFHHELQQLTTIREQLHLQSQRSIRYESIEKSSIPIFNPNNSDEIRQLEKEAHKKEITIAVERSSSMIQLLEKKISNLNSLVNNQKQWIDGSKETFNKITTQNDDIVAKLRKQLVQQQQIVNEIQQARINDKKELIKFVKESEDKIIQSQKKILEQFDKKIKEIQKIYQNKQKTENRRQQLSKVQEEDLQPVLQQAQSELKLLSQKDKDRDEQMQQQMDNLSKIVDDLKININNLHEEKGQLIEQLDAMNNLLQTQKKLYYSFRQH
ncbi:hypothetical protein pb186bvf_003233 [Paramecium bursaria]